MGTAPRPQTVSTAAASPSEKQRPVQFDLSTVTDADVLKAIMANAPFPDGKDIELGKIRVSPAANNPMTWSVGGGSVTLHAEAEAQSGLGVYRNPTDAIAALSIEDTGPFELPLASNNPHDRFAVLSLRYEVSGALSGVHPVGAVGALTFGVEGRRQAVSAVLHRFDAGESAQSVIAQTTGSWRFPRQVESASDLASGTWLITETEGQIAANIGAKLGYDFSYIRNAGALGLTGDIGFKLDANIKATLGIDVSGRYLVLLGREDASESLRLRILKLSKKGHTFGLNLAVGIKGETEALPDSVDDFVKAVFGVHGRQVVKDLLLIEKWTDPNLDLSDTVAGLANEAGLDLLRKTTGVDPKKAFAQAQEKLVSALKTWDALPERVAAVTWSLMEKYSADQLDTLKTFLLKLVQQDKVAQLASLTEAVSVNTGGLAPNAGPVVEWVQGIAEKGVLALIDRADELRQNALSVSSILSAGVIQKLQAAVGERLRLETIRAAATKADFDSLDRWLVQRLSSALDTKLQFEQLEPVKNAINTIVRKRQDVYAAAKKALGQRYNFDVAASYAKTTSKTAVLDATFNLSEPVAAQQFRSLLTTGSFDDLLTQPGPGVTFHTALLTHGIDKHTSVQVNMPFFSTDRDNITKSLASLAVENHGPQVSVFTLEANNSITERNRMRSELAVSATAPFAATTNVRVRNIEQSTWAYEYVSAFPDMRRADLESRVRPFVTKYLPEYFTAGGASSLDTWFSDLDRAVEQRVNNGSNEFGDTLMLMSVRIPGNALQSWFRKRTPDQLRQVSMDLSRALQTAVKELIPFYYLQDPKRLQQNPSVAALLTWAAIPPSTSARLASGKLTWNTDQQVFWNYVDPDMRRAMAKSRATSASLAVLLEGVRRRLQDLGRTADAEFFTANEAGEFQRLAITGAGDELLSKLLFFEACVVEQAAQTLRDATGFLDIGPTAPAKALERLAEFGVGITETFHAKLSTVYGSEALRTLGSLVFLEASRVLDPALRNTQPSALLQLTVLKEQRTFQIQDFLAGGQPAPEDVALTQTLATAKA